MCIAITVSGVHDMTTQCKQQSRENGLCYYHQKMKDLLIQPTDEVSQVVDWMGGDIYGAEARRHWARVRRGEASGN